MTDLEYTDKIHGPIITREQPFIFLVVSLELASNGTPIVNFNFSEREWIFPSKI